MHCSRPLLANSRLEQRPSCTHWMLCSQHQVLQLAHARTSMSTEYTEAVAAISPEATDAFHRYVALPKALDNNSAKDRHKDRNQRGSHRGQRGNPYRGRLLLKQEQAVFSELPASPDQPTGQPHTAMSSSKGKQLSHHSDLHQSAHAVQQPPHHQQQQHSQQQPYPQESLKTKNMGFSKTLKHLQGLPGWLDLLQDTRWGPRLCDLDGVSVVGALVWLVKSCEWQQGTSSWPWQLRQRAQATLELLLDRASDLITPQRDSSNSSTVAAAMDTISSSGSSTHSPPVVAAAVHAPGPLLRPAELASLVYCTSKLDQHRPGLLAAAAAALSQDLYACSSVDLNRLIWGLATARVHPGDSWLLNFCKCAQAKFFMCEPAHLSMMVYGAARLGYRPPDVWIAAWLETAEPLLGHFSAQNLANAAWGLSCWRFQAPSHWLDSLYAATQAAMSDMEPVGISQLQLALVTLAAGTPPPADWIQQMIATAEPLFEKMELLQLCNFGWGLAQWRFKPPVEVMQKYLAAVQPQLVAATPTDLSTLLWICDKLSFVPQQSWFHSWLASASASLPRCEPQHLTTMALVMGGWGIVPGRDFSMDFWRCCKARFTDFTAYQLGLLVWGLGMVQRSVPNTWTAALLNTFTQQLLPEAEPTDVCRLMGGLSSLNIKPHGTKAWVTSNPEAQQQLLSLCSWLLPQLGQLEPSWLLVVLKGLDGLGLTVNRAVVQGFTSAAAQFDERLEPEQRRFVLKVLNKMSRRAGSAAAQDRDKDSSSSSSSSTNWGLGVQVEAKGFDSSQQGQ